VKKQSCVRLLFLLVLVLLRANPALADVNDNVDQNYGAKGISPYREYSSFIPNELIDPFTGGLTLSIPIMTLPQNGGWNLDINLVYNSNIYKTQSFDDVAEDSWVGVGWTLHMGRLISPNTNQMVVEMPDGSSHPCYGASLTGPWKTKEDWLLQKTSDSKYELLLTDGAKYTFELLSSGAVIMDASFDQRYYYPTTKIQDACNNTVTINSTAVQTRAGSRAFIDNIQDTCGRTITFNYTYSSTSPSTLNSITYNGRTFTYFSSSEVGDLGRYKLLKNFQAPENTIWSFDYYTNFLLHEVKTPNLAKIAYEHISNTFHENQLGKDIIYLCVNKKTVSCPNGDCATAQWNYSYANGTTTTITCPENKSEVYTFWGYQDLSSGSYWKAGLLKSKLIYDGSTLIQEEDYPQWYGYTMGSIQSPPAFTDPTLIKPVLQQKQVKRGASIYTTTYSGMDADAHGHSTTIQEIGTKNRTTALEYWYNEANHIINDQHISEETVTVDSETYQNITTVPTLIE
jgi:hypothetical protein